ncbi:MAG: SurA N-terminal domain-containing protein [Planctomycetaceae bacterium]
MSERTHLTSNKRSTKKWAIVCGTILAITGAVVTSQFLKSKDTQAATDRQPASSSSSSQTNSAKMARVGNNFITEDQLKQECLERYGKEVLEALINRMVIQTACEREGIKVTEGEINQEIIEIAKRFQLEPDSWLSMLQADVV